MWKDWRESGFGSGGGKTSVTVSLGRMHKSGAQGRSQELEIQMWVLRANQGSIGLASAHVFVVRTVSKSRAWSNSKAGS